MQHLATVKRRVHTGDTFAVKWTVSFKHSWTYPDSSYDVIYFKAGGKCAGLK